LLPQELADVSTAKSMFIRHKSDVWDSLRSQRVAFTEANERLAQRSAEVADLRLLCDELKSEAAAALAQTEASSAREQLASQAEEMQQRQLELGQVIGEQDQSRSQAAEAVSRVEALRGQLAEATERLAEASSRARTLAESLSEAIGSTQSAQAVASQQRARAEVCFALFVSSFLSPFFTLCLKNFVRLPAGFETALNESVKNCKVLAQAAEQKEADRVAMFEAISAFCRAFVLSMRMSFAAAEA
jgi:hypothetical protein